MGPCHNDSDSDSDSGPLGIQGPSGFHSTEFTGCKYKASCHFVWYCYKTSCNFTGRLVILTRRLVILQDVL